MTNETEQPTVDAFQQAVRRAVRYELDSRFQLRKNGESWKQYIVRQFTVERIGLAAVLIFQFGGGVRDAQALLREAAAQAVTASTKADAASRTADQAAQALTDTRQELAGVIADLQRQAAANAELRDRVAQSVTRSEFASALAQQVLPRLERIERRQDGQR